MVLATAGAASIGFSLIWIVAIFALMYFMMIRPQKKEQKRVNAMLASMAVGEIGRAHV